MEHETARFRYLFRRLLKSVYAVVDNVAEELRASQFQPISFELGFGAGKDLPPVELSVDGMTVSISGFVDRVDGWEHDGRLYLRVVDYKTGRKTFDLTDIWNGMGLQMLLYLFTLEREGEALYNREIIPAGVLYLPARDAVVAGSRAMSEAERRRKVDAELRRRGIVLDEPEVLAAMEEPGEAGIRFLPVKVNKAGAITGEALVSAERLGKLARHTGRLLAGAGSQCRPVVRVRRRLSLRGGSGRRPTALPACRQGRGILAGGCERASMSWEPRYSPERNCSSLLMAESLHSSDQKSSRNAAEEPFPRRVM